MTRLVTFTIDDTTKEQIENLVRMTGKPEQTVMREVVKTGLKSYHTSPTKGIQSLLSLARWAEERHITGPSDLSTNHNKYAWEE